MKKNITLPLAAFLLSLLLSSVEATAQQPEAANYTYKVFQAPNKNFGYDIYQNGKIVYHEFASMSQPQPISQPKGPAASKSNGTNAAFSSKETLAFGKEEHAKKAAQLAIEKMKKKELPTLSRDEIKKIIAQ